MTTSNAPDPVFRNHDGLCWLESPILSGSPQIRHAFFSRLGGFSTSPHAGLNVGDHVGDSAENVTRNRKAVARALGFEKLLPVRQVHGSNIHIIEDNSGTLHADPPPEADAILCNRPGVALLIQTADCQAVLLADPKQNVIAGIHAGWRGLVNDIIRTTIQAMTERFGCRSNDLLAAVGPSLGPCCAEFIQYRAEIPEKYWMYRDDRMHFDLWKISRDQMRKAGIPAENIAVSGICTRCDPHRFFSYRAEKITGRQAAVIGMVLS